MLERVTFDASVLLGPRWHFLIAAVALRYCTGFWSAWIVAEIVRKRTEWISERALRDGVNLSELRHRLRDSRERVNRLITELARDLLIVDYSRAPVADLGWLADPDDWPVMQTAVAAQADTLVTDNSRDFPSGEERNGILLLTSSAFLSAWYQKHPDAETAIQEYLGRS